MQGLEEGRFVIFELFQTVLVEIDEIISSQVVHVFDEVLLFFLQFL